MLGVTVVLVQGGMPSTAVAPVEIFSTAGVLWNALRGEEPTPQFSVRTASLDGRPVRTGVCLGLRPDEAIRDVESTDVILVSAVGADLEAACKAHRRLYPWLCAWYERGAIVAGVCSGAALVAESGLLEGRPATTHWALVDACRRRYPSVRWQPERVLTECERVLCGGGVYAAIDLSLYLVERFCGHEVAMRTARALLLETPRVWQLGYAAEPPEATHGDERIRRAQEWLFQHFNETLRIGELASRIGVSPRTFARRFKRATGETPLGYLHRLRINAARHLLENDLHSVQTVCHEVGYEDVAHFRELFKRHAGCSPQQYRERFGLRQANEAPLAARTIHERRRS